MPYIAQRVPQGVTAKNLNDLADELEQKILALDRGMQPLSVITCPHCKCQATETMPTNACQFFYDCAGCGKRLKPHRGIARVPARLAPCRAHRCKRTVKAQAAANTCSKKTNGPPKRAVWFSLIDDFNDPMSTRIDQYGPIIDYGVAILVTPYSLLISHPLEGKSAPTRSRFHTDTR